MNLLRARALRFMCMLSGRNVLSMAGITQPIMIPCWCMSVCICRIISSAGALYAAGAAGAECGVQAGAALLVWPADGGGAGAVVKETLAEFASWLWCLQSRGIWRWCRRGCRRPRRRRRLFRTILMQECGDCARCMQVRCRLQCGRTASCGNCH